MLLKPDQPFQQPKEKYKLQNVVYLFRCLTFFSRILWLHLAHRSHVLDLHNIIENFEGNLMDYRTLLIGITFGIMSIPAEAQETRTGYYVIETKQSYSNNFSVSEMITSPSPTASDITPSLTGGAWANSAGGPTLTNAGFYYYLNISPSGNIPVNAKINSVSWSWGTSYKPSGLIVLLCHDTNVYCGNVTGAQSGATSYFNNRYANKKMIFAFGVQGAGTALNPPVYGRMNQVIVNYSY